MLNFNSLRLLAPLCGALLLVNVPVSFAQDDAVAADVATAPQYPAPAKTPEAAGERFYQFLSLFPALEIPNLMEGAFPPSKSGFGDDYIAPPHYDVSAISREQFEAVTLYYEFPVAGLPENIFSIMAGQKDELRFEGKIIGKEGEANLVEVAPAPPKKRAVVVVPEDGGFRVDLKATYGRWNDLSGKNLELAWYKWTQMAPQSLIDDPDFQRAQEKLWRSSCQTNLKQAMLGILQYSQDHQETFPTARKWIDEVMPYMGGEAFFRCPSLPYGSDYGYALNQNLDGLGLAKMDNPAQTVAIYETSDLTRNAFGVSDERAYRHDGGSNIAFADGHIKWFAQGQEPKESVSFKP